jgi:hypothetical protein
MVMLRESPAIKAFNAKPVPDGYERVKLVRSEGPTLRFHGRLLAEEMAPRLTAVLWETPGGAWVAARITRSERDNAADWIEAEVIAPDEDQERRRLAVMDVLRWSLPARALAKRMKWQFDEIID